MVGIKRTSMKACRPSGQAGRSERLDAVDTGYVSVDLMPTYEGCSILKILLGERHAQTV